MRLNYRFTWEELAWVIFEIAVILFVLVAGVRGQQFVRIQRRPQIITNCRAYVIESHGRTPSTWVAECKVTCDDVVIFGDEDGNAKLLPLAIPAKRKEALKAIDTFMEKRVPELAKQHCKRET